MAAKKKRDVLFVLDRESTTPLYRQIYGQARSIISQGTVSQGDRLPSIRQLAHDMQISHTTVEQAYLQLSIEGYVNNVPRSGYVVQHVDTEYLQLPKKNNVSKVIRAKESRSRDAFFAENVQGSEVAFDFSYANLQPDSFPVKLWRQLMNEVLYANIAPELTQYSYTDEPNMLRTELARYLGQARGVNCMPEQVLPQSGTDGSIATILQLFNRDEHILGMEEPGYATVQEVAQRLGFKLAPIPTDQGAPAFLDALHKYNPKIVFTTPSHQFPTGEILTLDARTELLKWAQENNSYIIEDDSCNEYRYNTSPIPSLQSLDAYSRVIYLGNVSKVLSPSMRIAYIVLPPKLLGRYYKLFNTAHPSVPFLEQEVFARFIKEGHWEQHIHKMAVGNRKRHEVLLRCLSQLMDSWIDISGAHSGMHLYITVHNDMTQNELIGSARAKSVGVYGTTRFWFSKPAPENNIMLGFSAINIDDIPEGIERLRDAWFS